MGLALTSLTTRNTWKMEIGVRKKPASEVSEKRKIYLFCKCLIKVSIKICYPD